MRWGQGVAMESGKRRCLALASSFGRFHMQRHPLPRQRQTKSHFLAFSADQSSQPEQLRCLVTKYSPSPVIAFSTSQWRPARQNRSSQCLSSPHSSILALRTMAVSSRAHQAANKMHSSRQLRPLRVARVKTRCRPVHSTYPTCSPPR